MRVAEEKMGLRERKKLQTRKNIAEVAEKLFAQRGYDHVTTAEIADAANVSIKTLFTYFPSKEDLVFEDENGLCDAIITCVQKRLTGETPLDAIRRLIGELVAAVDPPSVFDCFNSFRAMIDSNPALQDRLRLMWEHYEEALEELLIQETNAMPGDPIAHFAAMQYISLFRLVTSARVRDYLGEKQMKNQKEVLLVWLDQAYGLLSLGLDGYAVKNAI